MDIERKPSYCDGILRHIGRPSKENPFTKLRQVCDGYGLVLERAGGGRCGYLLSGGDLPFSGEHFRTLDDVKEELMNYGWEDSCDDT